MGSAILLEHVSKRFVLHHEKPRSLQEMLVNLIHRRNGTKEEFWALRDVTFAVGRGESLGIVGRNGSGKSTALKLITRILQPTSGRVSVAGKVSALIELGAGFHPDLTGRENVFLNGAILGLSRKQIQSRFSDIVAFAELERFIDTPVKHYSSGMYARLGFAVAISVDPDILIIDEVLAVGDESFQKKCVEKIREFKSRGVTVLFVSHSLDAIRSLCDKAVWLDDGVVRLEGRASDVAERYLLDSNLSDQERHSPGSLKPAGEPASGGARWGSGEVEITGVRLLDGKGRERGWFRSGETLVVRMTYRAKEAVRDPVFGVALYASDGTHVAGPNTLSSGHRIGGVQGEGWVDYVVPDLPLASGVYSLSVAVYDYSCTHAFDHQHRLYRLEVRRGSVWEDQGLVRIPCQWRHGESTQAARPVADGHDESPQTKAASRPDG